jgi:RNA polymerase sigma-70 factor, ECF subfamily
VDSAIGTRFDGMLNSYRRWILVGDEEAWNEFARATHRHIASSIERAVFHWCRPAVELVEDLTQETFLRLCINKGLALRGLRGETALELAAYLRVVAHNTVQDHFRALMAARRGGGQLDTEIGDNIAAASGGVSEVERRLLLDRIDRCLRDYGAGDRDRAIFWLYFRDGLSASGISRIGGIGLGAKGVESAILRLVKSVRDCVKGRLGPVPSFERRPSL